ncbi:hypothetical protein C815_01531 [Firmicutes bacterium M10-2]|nr:hypothetical protein C815_01531 [Firmicutes bacterium M10-2]
MSIIRKIIRPGKADDYAQVVEIENACFPCEQAASADSLKMRLENFAPYFLVCEQEGQLIGMINGMSTNEEDLVDEMYENDLLHDPHGSHVMIFGVDTLPSFCHQGIAHQLMDRFLKTAKAENKKSVVLTCLKELVPFYEQFGFENEGISKSEHGNVIWYQMRYVFHA